MRKIEIAIMGGTGTDAMLDACEHARIGTPSCPEIRFALIEAAGKKAPKVFDRAVFVCPEGPRLETPTEIQMFERLACDIAGMTGMPEAILARELAMCYATLCFITNVVAGLEKHLTSSEFVKAAKKTPPILQEVLRESVLHLPEKRRRPCTQAVE